MNAVNLNKYLTYQAKLLEMETTDIAEYLEFVIDSGMNDLWNKENWSFRSRSYTLVTDGTGTYQMPEDFEGVISVRETGSQNGNDLDIYTKEEYDSMITKPSAHAAGYPQAMCFYYNSNEGRWYADVFPTPTGTMNIEMQIATNLPPSIEAFPEKSEAALQIRVPCPDSCP